MFYGRLSGCGAWLCPFSADVTMSIGLLFGLVMYCYIDFAKHPWLNTSKHLALPPLTVDRCHSEGPTKRSHSEPDDDEEEPDSGPPRTATAAEESAVAAEVP